MKLREARMYKNITAVELANACHTDAQMISRFEHYKALPTPETMMFICKALGCDFEDIYSVRETSFADCKRKKKKQPNDEYKLTVRLPADFKDTLPEMVKAVGYANITDWILNCYVKLASQYQTIVKGENANSLTEIIAQLNK